MATGPRAYLDWNATAPVLPEVAEAVARAQALANPSSVHAEGRAARAAVEQARAEVAALVGAGPAQVIFTSGATEAAALALHGLGDGDHYFPGAAEHACLLAGTVAPSRTRVLPVDGAGRVDPAGPARLADEAGISPSRAFLAVQIANNETGTLNDAAEIRSLADQGFPLLCDAVQAAGKVPVDMAALGCEFLLLSAHKLGGPKGVGALVVRADACRPLPPLIAGGRQERGLRGGTENVAGIVGFGVAARIARQRLPEMARVATLRDRFEHELRALAGETVIFALAAPRLPNTSLFSIPGVSAETALMALDLDGVAVSSGAACSSGKVTRSHVLEAMGVDGALAAGAIRVSLGPTTTEREIDQCLAGLERLVRRLRGRQRPAA